MHGGCICLSLDNWSAKIEWWAYTTPAHLWSIGRMVIFRRARVLWKRKQRVSVQAKKGCGGTVDESRWSNKKKQWIIGL